MAEFLMPSLGADMEAGTLVAWKKQPGESVARGEIIAEVETEKGIIEVECFTEGVVERHLVAPGTKVPIGTKLAIVREGAAAVVPAPAPTAVPAPVPAEAAPPHMDALNTTPSARKLARELGLDAAHVHGTGSHGTVTRADVLLAERASLAPPSMPPPSAGSAPSPTESPVPSVAPLPSPSTRVAASPFARRLAEQEGLALAGVVGTGATGYVIADDVARALEARRHAKPVAAPDDAKARMRHAIAEAMTRSKREIPHYYLAHTIDLSAASRFLAEENAKRSVEDRILMGVLFVRAVARALHKVPELNACWTGESAPPLTEVNVGVAVSIRGGGLIAPAIRNADTLDLDALSRAFKDVVSRARSMELRASELSSPTITITSLGERGVETVFPVIIPPQVAMVGFGTVGDRALVVDGSVVARPAVTVTLAADHRVSDGHRGALFLATVATLLEEPPSP